MADLVYSRKRDASPLSFDDLVKAAPAAFTQDRRPDASGRYSQISTSGVIQMMRDYDYVPVQAVQRKARKEQDAAYAEHMLSFAHEDQLYKKERPEIVLYNSHNASSSMKLFSGYFRFICSNGMIAGQGFEDRARHVNLTPFDVEQMLTNTINNTNDLVANVDRMKAKHITPMEEMQIAERAIQLRWADKWITQEGDTELAQGSYYNARTFSDITKSIRQEDLGFDLWRVFNRMQEGLIRGGVRTMNVTERNPHGKMRWARPVGSIHENIRINKGLWDIVEDVMA